MSHNGKASTPPSNSRRGQRPVALVIAGLLAAGGLAGAQPTVAEAAPTAALTSYVNPMIGSKDEGATFPGAALPFGMVQLSPDTGYVAGYNYDQDRIRGFSLAHLSGVGCKAGGYFPILPMVGTPSSSDYSSYALSYSHTNEDAAPGRYAVNLTSGGSTIRAEMSATTRTGVQRYTFPSVANATVVINAGQTLTNVISSEVRIDAAARTVWAKTTLSDFCWSTLPFSVYTKTVFARDFSSYGTWSGSAFSAGSSQASASGRTGAWVQFDTTSDNGVELQSSLSYVSYDGAAANYAAEKTTLVDAEQAADATWQNRLSSVEVGSGTTEDLRVFYSALYRSMLAPNVGSDVDGSYFGWDRSVHNTDEENSSFVYYQNYSLWDTYRTQQQLLALLAPAEASDIARSLVLEGEQLWAPKWGLGPVETNVMTGDPITPTLVGLWSAGLLDADLAGRAYAVLKKNADEVPPAGSSARGRSGNANYIAKGFVTYTAHAENGDSDVYRGGSATLEYALADAALSTMAQALGHSDDAARYRVRAQNYRSIWDTSTQAMRARTAAGTFVSQSDPSQSPGFHEGTAIQYQWLVQQDVPGLVALMGGKAEAIKRLDNFFAYAKLLADPEATARNVWVSGSYSYYGTTTYNPNNEPDLHAPYTYLWVGQPWKSTDVVRAALTLFADSPSGVTGNDDLGTMAAWQVLSSLGIYPIEPGTDKWGLTTPIFEHVTIRLDQRFYPESGGSLTINAPGVSDSDRYTQSLSIDGRAQNRAWVDGADLRGADSLDFVVGATPSTWGTADSDSPGSMVAQEAVPNRITVAWPTSAVRVVPGTTTSVPITAVVQAAGSRKGEIKIDGGGPVAASSVAWSIDSEALPVSVAKTLAVTIPAGTPAGVYQAEASVIDDTDPAAAIVERRTLDFVVAGTPWLQSTFTQAAIDDQGSSAGASMDGDSSYYLTGELQQQGVYPGVDAVLPGSSTLHYRLSDQELDSLVANGQRIRTPGLEGATTVAFVGAGVNGAQSMQITLQYADGRQERKMVTLDDWCSTTTDNTVVAEMSIRGHGTGTQDVTCRLLASDPIPLSGRLSAILLSVNTKMHIVAIASDAPAAALRLSSGGEIVGTAEIGSPLTASTPQWNVAPVATGYQWLRDGQAILGATQRFHEVGLADAGHQLSVSMTGSADGWESATVVSAPVTVGACVAAIQEASSISGEAVVGGTLTADPGRFTPSGLDLTYQWYADSVAIEAATSRSLTLDAALVGKDISVTVTAGGDRQCTPASSVASASHAVRAGVIGMSRGPLVSGTAVVGGTLSVDTGAYTPTPDVVTVRWLADGKAIPGAEHASLEVGPAQAGALVTVEVTARAAGYTDRLAQASAGVVTRSPITTTGSVSVTGAAKLGQTLHAVVPAYSQEVQLGYRWLRDGVVVGAEHGADYRLTPDDVGHVLAVVVTAVTADGNSLSQVSKPTAVIAPGQLRLVSKLQIRGTAKVGRVLTVAGGVTSPTATRLIQWLRNGKPIAKATSTRYKLTKNDRRKVISVRVRYSRDGFVGLQLSARTGRVR